MKRIMTNITIISAVLTALFAAVYFHTKNGVSLSLAITAGTTLYHFAMRLAVGYIFNFTMKNHADLDKKWYRQKRFEKPLYEILRVRKWKGKLPTYQPEWFSAENHTWDEIARAMCQAELVHETIIILSFVPIFFTRLFGAFAVFFITSLCAAIFDALFVIMQRYNRPRVMKLVMRERKNYEDQ